MFLVTESCLKYRTRAEAGWQSFALRLYPSAGVGGGEEWITVSHCLSRITCLLTCPPLPVPH